MGHPVTNSRKVTTQDNSGRIDRVAVAVTHQGSHRHVRTHIRAHGSSANRFGTPEGVPGAIRSSSVDMRESLDVFSTFPPVKPAGR
jgi:hypothetical protein